MRTIVVVFCVSVFGAGVARAEPPGTLHVVVDSELWPSEAHVQRALAPEGGTPLAGGASLHAIVQSGRWGALVGAAALSPATQPLLIGNAVLVRLPFDVSARGTLRRGRIALSLDVGLLANVFIVEG